MCPAVQSSASTSPPKPLSATVVVAASHEPQALDVDVDVVADSGLDVDINDEDGKSTGGHILPADTGLECSDGSRHAARQVFPS